MNTREIVLEILLALEKGDEYSHLLIRAVLDKYDFLDSRDKAFIKRLTEGTIERRITLDYILNQFSKISVSKMKPFIRCLLRMSVYQILYMEQTADFAVCNEAVKLAGKRGFHNLKGFVNGVLRTIIRERESINLPESLSIRYSMPEWIVELFEKEQGEERTKRILEEMLCAHPVTVRARDMEWTPDVSLSAKRHPYLPYAWNLWNTDNLMKLPDFANGRLIAQDVSSMLVGEIAGFAGNEKVLDICAAPGGKSMHAADLVKDGCVEARDVSDYKTSLICENAKRLDQRNIVTKTWDATILDPDAIGKFDVVLADVPCSGLGVMGRKRDIKYRVTPQSLQELTMLQRCIMDTVWQYVKPGGTMIYSTCTIHRAENEEMVAYLTSEYPFITESLDDYLPVCLRSDTTGKGYLQLLPGIHECDGFFIARLKRV